jgi:general secretion pathway protein A
MYRAFFGFRDRPFDLTPNPRFLVLTDAHREALSNLEYGIASRRGITALIGEAGTGKTTLIRTALARQSDKVHCVYLNNPALTRAEFVEMLATRFQLREEAQTSKAVMLTDLEAALKERHLRGESTVLIVDEAQSLPLELLEEIRLLGNIETAESKLLSIVLAGQPELAARLNQSALRQLKQRIALRCDLRALTETETAAYLAGRIRVAGGVGAQVFTREAVLLIHKRSHGIPRAISVIADNALLSAYAVQRKPVNSQMVAEVCRDLDLQAPDLDAPATPLLDREAPAPIVTRTEPAAVLAFDSGEHSAPDDRSVAADHELRLDIARPIERPRERDLDRDRDGGRDDRARDRDDDARGGGGMFASMFPKRRRFGFF